MLAPLFRNTCNLVLCLTLALPLCAYAGNTDNISVFCIEADRGLVLYEKDADVVRPPASMIKLMLMLMVVEGYERGDWTADTAIPVSAHAESMGGTQVFLKAGEMFPLGELMRALTIASANDAAMAIAEGLWGSEAEYLRLANERAQELGMENTTINGVHGLPPEDGKSFDETTARDMAKLALRCVVEPQIMSLAGQKEFQFRPTDTKRYSTNKLLWRMEDCDGLKTGYIRAAGFCIAATAERHGRRLICIVMGSPSKYGRFQLAEDTLNSYLDDYAEINLLDKGAPLDLNIPVSHGKTATAAVATTGDLSVTLPRKLAGGVQVSAVHPASLEAPLEPATVVGELTVSLDDITLATVPLMVSEGVEVDGWYLTVRDGVARWNGLAENNPVTGSSEAEQAPE